MSIKKYPLTCKDWLGDYRLRSCSLSARGLFIDLAILMRKNRDNPGHLQINGKTPNSLQLSRIVGCEIDELVECVGELIGAGVISRRGPDRILFCQAIADRSV